MSLRNTGVDPVAKKRAWENRVDPARRSVGRTCPHQFDSGSRPGAATRAIVRKSLIRAQEPSRLLPIEAQTRHFQVLTANALQDVRDTDPVNATSSGGVSGRALRFRIVLQARGPDLSPG